MKTSNWILQTSVNIPYGPHDVKVVPAGSFVSPVKYEYLPKHIKEEKFWQPYHADKDIYCYTKYGFIKVEKSQLRETS